MNAGVAIFHPAPVQQIWLCNATLGAQVYGGLVYMDFGPLAQTGRGVYEPLDPGLLPPLHLMWSDSPSHSGKVGM